MAGEERPGAYEEDEIVQASRWIKGVQDGDGYGAGRQVGCRNGFDGCVSQQRNPSHWLIHGRADGIPSSPVGMVELSFRGS